jgi:hypothetical protein
LASHRRSDITSRLGGRSTGLAGPAATQIDGYFRLFGFDPLAKPSARRLPPTHPAHIRSTAFLRAPNLKVIDGS